VAHIANPAPIYPFLIIYYSWIIWLGHQKHTLPN
jgi:hypothetical protein